MSRALTNATPIAVVFDGYCRACTRIVAFLRRRDPEGLIRTMPNQAPAVLDAYGLTKAEVQRAVWVIEDGGARYEGAAAANRIFEALGGPWRWLAKLYRFPPIRWAEDTFYHWFSRNRHHFGWMWSNLAFCEEPGAACLPPWDAIAEATPGPSPAAIGGGGGGPEQHPDRAD